MAIQTRYITTKEAAALLGKDHSTIRRWVAGDKLKAVRVGKINLISRRVVERMIERRNGTTDQGEVN